MYTSKPEMSPIMLFHDVCAALQIKSIKQDLNDNSNKRHFAAIDLVLHGAAAKEVAFQMKG